MNQEIQFEDIKLSLIALWHKKLLVVAITIMTTLIGLLFTFGKESPNIYIAESKVFSSVSTEENASNNNNLMTLQSFSDIAISKKVCERAASILGTDLGLDALAIQGMTYVDSSSDITLSISVRSEFPEVAMRVANAVTEAFVREVTGVTGTDTIRILDTADDYQIYSEGSKKILMQRLIFTMFGLIASAGWILLSEFFSNKLKSISQCVGEDADEIISVIPKMD